MSPESEKGPPSSDLGVYGIAVGPTVAITRLVTNCRFKHVRAPAKSLKSTTLCLYHPHVNICVVCAPQELDLAALARPAVIAQEKMRREQRRAERAAARSTHGNDANIHAIAAAPRDHSVSTETGSQELMHAPSPSVQARNGGEHAPLQLVDIAVARVPDGAPAPMKGSAAEVEHGGLENPATPVSLVSSTPKSVARILASDVGKERLAKALAALRATRMRVSVCAKGAVPNTRDICTDQVSEQDVERSAGSAPARPSSCASHCGSSPSIAGVRAAAASNIAVANDEGMREGRGTSLRTHSIQDPSDSVSEKEERETRLDKHSKICHPSSSQTLACDAADVGVPPLEISAMAPATALDLRGEKKGASCKVFSFPVQAPEDVREGRHTFRGPADSRIAFSYSPPLASGVTAGVKGSAIKYLGTTCRISRLSASPPVGEVLTHPDKRNNGGSSNIAPRPSKPGEPRVRCAKIKALAGNLADVGGTRIIDNSNPIDLVSSSVAPTSVHLSVSLLAELSSGTSALISAVKRTLSISYLGHPLGDERAPCRLWDREGIRTGGLEF
ncbi:hypothetical protein B0H13DRAFT_1886910 [Mycena leptocephala]|nr:hypothetical protein B0H13DRAFT_1886910 [Mycena leptocephala]